MTKEDLLQRVRELPAGEEFAVAIWQEDDVRMQSEQMGIKLSNAKIKEVMNLIDRKQNCEMGITWATIECAILKCREN